VRDGVRGGDQGALGLCAALRVRGVRIRVDPQVPVVQPFALWTPAFVGLGDSRPYTVSPFVVFSTWTRLPGWPLA
jgi:hypothetical protein